MLNLKFLVVIIGFVIYNTVIITTVKNISNTNELSGLRKVLLGLALCADIVTLVMISCLMQSKSNEITVEPKESSYCEEQLSDGSYELETTEAEAETSIYDDLASTLFDFVDKDTGRVVFNNEQSLDDKLTSDYNVSIENYDFDTVNKYHSVSDKIRLYKYTVVSPGKNQSSTNEFGEWVIAQMDKTVDIENVVNANGDIADDYVPINTVLHIGTDNNTSKADANIYLPSETSKTYFCLAELDLDNEVVNLYPIFFSTDPHNFYIVKSNLHKINLDNTSVKDISTVVDTEKSNENNDSNILSKSVSSTNNNVTVEITSVTDGEITGTVENKNTFEVYIDNATWSDNDVALGESLIRVKANSKQEIKLNYTDKIEKGTELSISGEMKDVDAAFSSIGDVKFTFKLE